MFLLGFPGSTSGKESICLPMHDMQESQVRSWVWEDPLEKEMATHSSTLAWKIPWMEEPRRLLQSMGSQRFEQTERLHFHLQETESV